MKFGYARISTPKQSLVNQIALLKDAGCDEIFSDTISGYNSKKVHFEEMMKRLRREDVVVVTGVDRLGRSTKDLAILIEEFHQREIHLLILGHNIDTRTSHGKMIFDMMALIAENERNRNLERIRQGIEGARKRGKHVGRPYKLNNEKTKRMKYLFDSKQLSVKELCLMYGISRGSLYNYIRKENEL